MAESKNFLERIESLIKLIGAGVTIVVVFGYPAIYFHLKSFDLPLHIVGYKSILYAGIIPTFIFVIFLGYGYWVYQQFQKDKGILYAFTLIIIFIPVFLIEYLALLVMIIYWSYEQIFQTLGYKISNTRTLNIALISFLATILIIILILRSGFLRSIRLLAQRNIELKHDQVKATNRNGNKYIGYVLLGVLLLAAIPYVGYLSLSKLLEIRFPNSTLSSDTFKDILFNVSITLSLLLFSILSISFINKQALAKKLFLGLYIFGFIVLGYVYSTNWYKKIDTRLGGGKPIPINIWVKKTDFPNQITQKYGEAITGDTSLYVKWIKGSLLMENDNEIAITNPDSGWIIIPKDKIIALER